MKIEQLSPDKLIPYEFNNKIHNEKQINLLANSIRQFGFNQPVVIDDKNVVVAGHARLEAAKKLGLKTIPVLRKSDLSDDQIRIYRLLDNKISEYETENDLENMKIEVDMLGYDKTMDGLDVSLKDLYPEFDAPPFDPDEYKEDEKKEGQVAVIVFFKNFGDAELCKTDLEGLGYAPIVKG